MAHKCVCDICGADAYPHEFIVPFVRVYRAEMDGVKLFDYDKFETCTVNFCSKHYRKVASALKAMRDECMKT